MGRGMLGAQVLGGRGPRRAGLGDGPRRQESWDQRGSGIGEAGDRAERAS